MTVRSEPTASAPHAIDRPAPSPSNGRWVSDVMAETLRALRIPYAALNPGASYHGLHDSIVNHLGNETPQLLLCLHDEHAVAIAHGWAKVSETPMAAILHSNVGLMHGAMAIFNAWCDRVPVLVLGATGPVDAAKRRPWIDWIHTAADQAALVRNYVKWDNQPASAAAAVEALLRANLIARTLPKGPVYVCLDAGLQETPLTDDTAVANVDRFQPPAPPEPSHAALTAIADLLKESKRPVLLCGRGARAMAAWQGRIALAERLGAAVITDLKTAASFPNTHPLHADPAGIYIGERSAAILRAADVIISLDWVDLGGVLKTAGIARASTARIVHASMDQTVHNGWSMDHQILPPVDHAVLSDPDTFVSGLLALLGPGSGQHTPWFAALPPSPPAAEDPDALTVASLGRALRRATEGRAVSLVRVASAWSGELWNVDHPLDFLGYDGGGGLASGPGLLVGAALALKDSARLPVAVLGDGDFLMGHTALWTAAHYGIPGLVVVANNRSYFNDEVHQERIARIRGRNVANKWVGQAISEPDIDIARLAESLGCVGIGPVERLADVEAALRTAIAAVLAGKVAVVDVRVLGEAPPGVATANVRT